jgi:hypothetical protein
MFGPDPNWFMSLVMLYIPFVVVAFAALASWTWLRRQIVPVPIEVRR